ncbi:YSC84-related protein [Pseudoduganella sp. LjRoot289]|uniref:BPSL1445 family SYLF domain-containing lipoprotein n=1 Tax=Pseudoduganella sp. LjRoot289 TaxID=3342314 RepID=UPI003ED09D6D
MRKRIFLFKTAAALALFSAVLAGCTTTTSSGKPGADDSRAEIDAGFDTTLNRLYAEVKGSRELVAKSHAILVFPRVLAAGFVVGGEYGKGTLRVKGAHGGYYRMTSASVGLQAGAQSKAVVMLFMTKDAFEKFGQSKGWTAGVDASVAVVKVGVNGEIDTTTANNPVQAFVLTNAGLMANLTLEGTKITKLEL